MKKQLLILLGLFLAFSLQAKVAYLLSNDCSFNAQTGELTGFPAVNIKGTDQAPERDAAQWFYTNYVAEDKGGAFVTSAEFVANNSDIDVLWIFMDRDINREGVLTAFGGDSFKAALKAYVERGGNLFLAKQANRFLNDIDRTTLTIDHNNTGYTNAHGDIWSAAVDFDGHQHKGQDHAIFKGMSVITSEEHKDWANIEFQKTKSAYIWGQEGDWHGCTDNNCGISRVNAGFDGHQCDKSYIETFDSDNTAYILGGWGGTGCCDYVGIAEFYPTGDYKGTVLMMGLAAYQWDELNEKIDNVKLFTKNVIDYLNNKPTAIKDELDNDFPKNGRWKDGGFTLLHPNVHGYAATYTLKDGYDATKASIVGDRIVFTAETKVTLQIKVIENAAGKAWPKGDYVFEQEISFAFDKLEPVQGWPAALDANVNAGTEVELYDITEGFNATYTFAPAENVEYNSETHTVKFLKEGTVKITATVVVDKDVPTFPRGTYPYYKDVTVVPTLAWTTYPQSGFVGEQGKVAVAAATGTTKNIVYASSDKAAVEVDAEGNLTIHEKRDTKVTITATIEGTTISISGEMDANDPFIEWATAPAASALVCDQPAIKAQLKYWEDHELDYVCEKCSVVGGKLIFTEAGTTAKVKAHVVLDGNKDFYSEEKEISVSAVTFNWTHEPDHAIVGEGKEPAQATCNVQGATVKYKSSDATIAEIDETSGQITYLHAGNCNISAYVVINGKEYSSEAFVLNVGHNYYKRQNITSTYSTLCLEYAATLSAEVEHVYTLAGVTKNDQDITSIVLDEYTGVLEAGVPYIIMVVGTEFTADQVGRPAPVVCEKGLMGTLVGETIYANWGEHNGYIYYLATDGLLHLVTGTATVKIGANKAFFNLEGVEEVTPDKTQAPGRMIMGVHGNPISTNVESAIDAKAVKFIQNGKVYIRRGNKVYDILGK